MFFDTLTHDWIYLFPDRASIEVTNQSFRDLGLGEGAGKSV